MHKDESMRRTVYKERESQSRQREAWPTLARLEFRPKAAQTKTCALKMFSNKRLPPRDIVSYGKKKNRDTLLLFLIENKNENLDPLEDTTCFSW
jgi:hypothetical protein